MAISAADVKKLRDATGAGMVDAKKALTEADGDFEKATELLRVSGAAKAAKRADREASNGVVAASGHALIQLGSETDFVAKNEQFTTLAAEIAGLVDEGKVEGKVNAGSIVLKSDVTVADAIAELSAATGEKIELVEVAYFDGQVHTYLHKRSQDLPPQVGVMIEYTGDDAELVHQVALQIASMQPEYVTRADVPAEVVERETRIATETAKEEGKPEQIIPRIVEGRLNAYYKDAVLIEQVAIADDKQTVGKLLEKAGVTVTRFVRFSAAS